jgi:hypothetical protein
MLNYMYYQAMAIAVIMTAQMAGINPGIIMTIWNVRNVMMATLDYMLNGTRLKYFHKIGIITITASAFLLGFAKPAD